MVPPMGARWNAHDKVAIDARVVSIHSLARGPVMSLTCGWNALETLGSLP